MKQKKKWGSSRGKNAPLYVAVLPSLALNANGTIHFIRTLFTDQQQLRRNDWNEYARKLREFCYCVRIILAKVNKNVEQLAKGKIGKNRFHLLNAKNQWIRFRRYLLLNASNKLQIKSKVNRDLFSYRLWKNNGRRQEQNHGEEMEEKKTKNKLLTCWNPIQ